MKKIGLSIGIIVIILSFSIISMGQYTDPLDDFTAYIPDTNLESRNTEFIKFGSQIIGVIQVLSTFAAVIAVLILGIRYMVASTGEKAVYKETMVPYLIGAIMVFAIPNILAIIYTFVTSNIK